MNLRSCCSKLCSILRPGIDKILYFCIWSSLSYHMTSLPSSRPVHIAATERKSGIERVQALADISRSAVCCHSNVTRAPIANLPNSAQLEGTPYHSPTYIRVRAVMWERGDGQTDTQTGLHRRPWPLYISPRLRLTRNVTKWTGSSQFWTCLELVQFSSVQSRRCEKDFTDISKGLINLKVLCFHTHSEKPYSSNSTDFILIVNCSLLY